MAAIYTPYFVFEFYLTSTLYPVEISDDLELSISIDASGTMELVPQDFVTHSHELRSGSYTQTRWFYFGVEEEDYVSHSHELRSGSYTQTRWFLEDGPYDDYVSHSHVLVSADYILKLVEADTPDEELQLNVTIDATCTMDLI